MHLLGVPLIGHVNWVIGWLLFQVAGFAWRDGKLPTGRMLAALAVVLWTAAVAVVRFGPWPVAMVHFPGLAHSPTHPPSIALVLFGAAYSATALLFAPAVSRWLAGHARAWSVVVAANTVSMSVYLWHMTAAVAAGLLLWSVGWLPTAAVGTGAWWLQKTPLVLVSLVFLVAVITRVARYEQRALLAGPTPWRGGTGSMVAVAVAVSTTLRLWSAGSVAPAAIGIGGVLVLWHLTLRPAGARDVAVPR
ncbi:MAG: hypothetical protein R2695_08355 [Acidimicrobiales bacterium]